MSACFQSCSLFCHLLSSKLVIQQLLKEVMGCLCWRRGQNGMLQGEQVCEQKNRLITRSSMVLLPLLSLFSSACETLLSSKCVEQECTNTVGQVKLAYVHLAFGVCTEIYLQGCNEMVLVYNTMALVSFKLLSVSILQLFQQYYWLEIHLCGFIHRKAVCIP